MEAICGIIGKRDSVAVKAMAAALKHRGASARLIEGEDFTVASSGLPAAKPSASTKQMVCLLDGKVSAADGPLTSEGLSRLCNAISCPTALSVKGAFAAVVRVGKKWWLLRDRLGIAPLYYAEAQGCLVFASELKGILASGYVPRHLNLASVDRYLTLRCVPGAESIIQGVRRVAPGHVVEYGDGRLESTRYAGFDFEVQPTTRKAAAVVLRNRLEELLKAADTRSLMWSAGIDSATLAALLPDSKAFFVVLKSAWQDEKRQARESARLLDIPFKTAKAPAVSAYMLGRAAYHLDEPVADASVLPLWMIGEQLSGFGARFLSGHGADEIFGGYPRYHFLHKARGAKRLIPVNFLSEIAPSLPPNAFVRRGGHALKSIRDNLGAYLSLLAVFDAGEREELYTGAMRAAIHEKGGSAAILRPHFADDDLPRNLLSLDINVGLPDLILAGCDRVMAAHGIALEFPYLDDDLLDFAVSLPSKVKYGVRSKPLLRQAMKGILPGRVRLRARRGFRIPQSGPAMRVLDNAAREIVSQERVENSGLFRWPYVAQILSTSSHNLYRRRQFWALLMFFAWYREYMEG